MAEQPLKDIIVVMRDTGMRNARELYCMRGENVDFNAGTIFTPDSKTASGRRFIPMSSRVKQILEARREGRSEGWGGSRVTRKNTLEKGWCTGSGHRRGKPRGCPANLSSTVRATTSVASSWRRSVMNAMGHGDVRSAMAYQHPEGEIIRHARCPFLSPRIPICAAQCTCWCMKYGAPTAPWVRSKASSWTMRIGTSATSK